MGYSRMICAGNRVMVLFEGYSQEELTPILKILNELVMNSGNVPQHLIPPEMKVKSGEEAMSEVLKQAGTAAGRQEKVAEKRKQTLSAGIQPPKFMQNAMQPETAQTAEKELEHRPAQSGNNQTPISGRTAPEKAVAKPQPKPSQSSAAQPKPDANQVQTHQKPSDLKAASQKADGTNQPITPRKNETEKAQEQMRTPEPQNNAMSASPVTMPQAMAEPEVKTRQPEPKETTPDVFAMSKAELRNFFAATDRMVLQKILLAKGEFPNRGIFLGRASEQQMREYANLVINA